MISDGCRHMPLHAADHLYLPSATSTHQATDGPVESAWDSSSVLEVAIRIESIMPPRFVPPARARFLRPQAPMMGSTQCQRRSQMRLASDPSRCADELRGSLRPETVADP